MRFMKTSRIILCVVITVSLNILYWKYDLIRVPDLVSLKLTLGAYFNIASQENGTAKTDYDLRIIVIGYNRPIPLSRLLKSLNEADYVKDKVTLEVWLDCSKKLNVTHSETFVVANEFRFKHGSYVVNNHTHHVGICGQWMMSWRPTRFSKEIVVILEDDLTVSPHFYRYLKKVHKKYHNHTNINGYSLNGKNMKHGGAGGYLKAPEVNNVFLYPVLGTWGFSPQLQNWISFVEWYSQASEIESFVPDVPGLVTTAWFKEFIRQGKADSMWSQWHIYHAWENNLLTLFPNLPNYAGFATSWKEEGLHYSINGKPDLLWTEWDDKFDNLPDYPVRLDANGNVISA